VSNPLPPPIYDAETGAILDPDTGEDISIERFAIGREADKLKPGESSSRYFNLVRPDPDKPCPTVTQTGGSVGAASVIHPLEPRKLTISELKRLSGFPDDFTLAGSYRQQYERLGRAVPPPLMKAIAETLRDEVLLPYHRREAERGEEPRG
jgi:DNA (cytosine-5)-methyltransferase 1